MLKNNKAFTLVEMLVVLLIITIIILLVIPNLTGRSEHIHTKGCDALIILVQAQVSAYELDNGTLPEDFDALIEENYINENQTVCEDGTELTLENGIIRS